LLPLLGPPRVSQ